MTTPICGRCLCGTVRFEVSGTLSDLLNCHCQYCRKSHGASFATFGATHPSGFAILSGEEAIVRYRASANMARRFCRVCGSILPFEENGLMSIPAGSITDPVSSRLTGHIFVSSKADYHDITDTLPQYANLPASMKMSPAGNLDRTGTPPLSGSCLCNQVAFTCSEPPLLMMNCHCDRCKRSRSAAHATNVFVNPGTLQFLRGEDMLTQYRLPDAQRFGTAFCGTCGALMPRVVAGQTRVAIPAGCLDTHPRITPHAHIWVSRRANWFDITDEVPQYAEGMT